MIVTIKSTNQIIELNGAKVRIWEGRTASGIGVTVFVGLVCVLKSEDQSQFISEVDEVHEKPTNVWPLRMFLD